MSQWAYEMSNRELLSAFAEACARSGLSNSGIIMSFTGSMDAERARYLRGVLLSRLDGLKPPFKPGDVVKPSGNGVSPVSWRHGHTPLPQDKHQKILSILYAGNGDWLLELEGTQEGEYGRPQFNAKAFVLVASVAAGSK